MRLGLLTGLLFVALLLLAFGVPFAGLLMIRRRQLTRLRAAGLPEVPGEIRRRMAAGSWGGAGVGLVVAVISGQSGSLGRGPLLAAPLFGLCVVLGVLAGELSVGQPSTGVRRAEVSVRRVGDYLPPLLTPVVTVTTLVLAVLLVAATLMGSPDDLGRAGRSLSARCPVTPDGAIGASNGPWPGSYYSIPLTVMLLAGLAAAALALIRIARRPRPGDPLELGPMDDLLRRRAATVVIGSCGVLAGIPLIGISWLGGAALLGNGCGPSWWGPAGSALLLLSPVWLAVLGWSLAAVFVPSPALPATAPERVG
jgi:hypothetical protein